MEIATLKPLFAQKLNYRGYSPMHLALQNKHYDIVRALMILDPKLIRVRGRGRITPLHFVAKEIGDNEQENVELLELLAEFLYACKSSIEDLTNQCKTAIHVAVKTGNTEAFKVLFGWLKRVHLTKILDWKDQNGDTVLHIAASKRQPEIIKLLIGYTNIYAKNFQGNTALEIFQLNPSGDPDVAERFHHQGHQARRFITILSLSQFYSMELTFFEKYINWFRVQNKSAREVMLIVSTLIAAATYQAALAPPKGYRKDSSSGPWANSAVVTTNSSSIAFGKPHQAGDLILSGLDQYMYTICNSLAFFASIATILATALTLGVGSFVCSIYGPICLLCCLTQLCSLLIQIPKTNAAAGNFLGVLWVFSWLAASSLTWYVTIKLQRDRRRIDATRRRV
ncbi:hypothetical protein ACJRO7_017799 [Eucalyptus globulus]|uniref:PGG domain-containing protein n=1 Tax=Eucalyptus globulus TaxID=34317 RepID=A0ABD3L2J4_EUCGL